MTFGLTRAIVVVLGLVTLASPTTAQRCVAQGDGRTWGDCNSGGSSTPTYSAPIITRPPERLTPAQQHAKHYMDLGTAAEERGDNRTALRHFEQWLKLQPDNVIAHNVVRRFRAKVAQEDAQARPARAPSAGSSSAGP